MAVSPGQLLRDWRNRRHLSQLDLASAAGVSSRHLSFIETGRSRASRTMILRLAQHLDVPLRERNQLLLAAGFAPEYGEAGLDSDRLAAIQAALKRIIGGHAPYPAMVVDRHYTVVHVNRPAYALLTEGVSPELLEPPVNTLRVSLHPKGFAPRIVNHGEWRAHLLSRLRETVASTADATLAALYEELSAYPCDQDHPEVSPSDVVVPLRLRFRGAELAFISTVASFHTARDVTVAELLIESFFPADDQTATFMLDERFR